MPRKHSFHVRRTHHLPSWQGGSFDYPICRSVKFGAPTRGFWCFARADRPHAVNCVDCRRALGLPIVVQRERAAA